MPIYAYRCASCGHAKDVLQRISDAPLTVCPSCGAAAFAKQVTAAGFQLKGSGWYATDFKGGVKKPDTGESTKTEAGKTDAGQTESGKTDAGKTDAGKTETAKTETAKTESGKGGSSKSDSAKSGDSGTSSGAGASSAPKAAGGASARA